LITWNYAYTPYIWPSVFTVLLLIALAVYSWHRRSMPGALPFMIGCLFVALWAAGSDMEYAWSGRWLTCRNLTLLAIAPLWTLGLILTNDLHHLAWPQLCVRWIGLAHLHPTHDQLDLHLDLCLHRCGDGVFLCTHPPPCANLG